MKIIHRVLLMTILIVFSSGIASGDTHLASYVHLRYSSIPHAPDYISIRRLILFGKSDFTKNTTLAWRSIYPYNNKSSTDNHLYLQDCYLDIHISSSLNLRIGQFKPPFGWERFIPDYKIVGVERALVIDRLIPLGSIAPSFARDYGIQLSGDLKKSLLSYEFGITTGNGANRKLTMRNGPLLTGRLSLMKTLSISWIKKPWLLLFQAACSYRQNRDIDFTKQLPGEEEHFLQNFRGDDKRLNITVNLSQRITDLTAEYISTQLNPTAPSLRNLKAQGLSCYLAHFIHPRIQIILKYETFDPNKNTATAHGVSLLTVGTNFYFSHQNGRFMLNYMHRTEKNRLSADDTIILQLQYFLFGGNRR